MMECMRPYLVRDLLEAAVGGKLPSSWVYLPRTDDISLESSCMLVPDDEDVEANDDGIPIQAARCGLPRAGMNRDMMEDVVAWAKKGGPLSLLRLLEGLVYHLKNDAVPATPR